MNKAGVWHLATENQKRFICVFFFFWLFVAYFFSSSRYFHLFSWWAMVSKLTLPLICLEKKIRVRISRWLRQRITWQIALNFWHYTDLQTFALSDLFIFILCFSFRPLRQYWLLYWQEKRIGLKLQLKYFWFSG